MAHPSGEFALWIRHFESNADVHAATDAAIDFGAHCALPAEVRAPLIASVRRFQLGESGDGAALLSKAALAGDPEYVRAAELFVAEEQQHADLLARLLDYLGGERLHSHWSDGVFVWLRRLMGLRTELMVLTVAEVVALSYYGALAERTPDAVTRAVAERILADEGPHVRFQRQRLHAGFAEASRPARWAAFAFWWATTLGASTVVALDHGGILTALGYRRRDFIRDVLDDFADVVGYVLQ
ncbi:ferritin-like domain-containing protein [Mycolicibacterium sp.]|uniref:ferritin-like domain-containing protein n=1 Tax=Mycolicibacterium sp. TaxID=2320850 RepID=UPI003D0CAB9D